jgi:uncharacterized protein (DUF2147 family)
MTASRWMGLATLGVLLATSALAKGPSAVGSWTTIDDSTKKPRSIVTIWEEGGKLFGKIDKLYRQPNEPEHPLCEKCDGELKNKPVLGMVILRNLKPDGDGWSGGTVLDPENGKTYKVKLALEDGGKRLKVRGYVGFSLLGRTQHWLRAEQAPTAVPTPAPQP